MEFRGSRVRIPRFRLIHGRHALPELANDAATSAMPHDPCGFIVYSDPGPTKAYRARELPPQLQPDRYTRLRERTAVRCPIGVVYKQLCRIGAIAAR